MMGFYYLNAILPRRLKPTGMATESPETLKLSLLHDY
jgi:hypothetical protein